MLGLFVALQVARKSRKKVAQITGQLETNAVLNLGMASQLFCRIGHKITMVARIPIVHVLLFDVQL